MNNETWKNFLRICRQVLGKGAWDAYQSESWCAYTTFSSLEHGVHYWSCGFPDESDFCDTHTADGSLWRQPLQYQDLAHVIIPKSFYWEIITDKNFESGYKTQDLEMLSCELDKANISYRKTNLILEIKLY
jgi:hypothetical protein